MYGRRASRIYNRYGMACQDPAVTTCRQTRERQPAQRSCARTVLRPFALARLAACSMYQYTIQLRPSRAWPAVLQPPFFIRAFAFDPTKSISSFFAIGHPLVRRIIPDIGGGDALQK